MQGKILIVDAISTNRIALKVQLASAFYEVVQAASAQEACTIARIEAPDLIISALSLPDGTAAQLPAMLQAHPATRTIPIIGVGCRPDQATRLATLEAGVQDIFLRPVEYALLLARVRSLIRAHNSAEEWQMRDDTSRALGFAEKPTEFGPPGRAVIVSANRTQAAEWMDALRPNLRCEIAQMAPDTALRDLSVRRVPDVIVLVLSETEQHSGDVMRLLAAIRANAATRHAGLLILQKRADPSLGAYALDLGADDLMTDGFYADELALRIKALMRRKRIGDQLRATVRTGLQAAVCDQLTGLHNRRYALPHLNRIAEHAAETGRPFAVMVADLDHFKRINDHYGHASGDAVLIETARRLRDKMRAGDMVARIGGEEFLIVMPATTLAEARVAASRLCHEIGSRPFNVPGTTDLVTVTVSIGMTMGGVPGDTAKDGHLKTECLMDAADKALYAAKLHGRNQVTLRRVAA